MSAAQLLNDDPLSIDEAITYALDDVRAARVRAERSPNGETLAQVERYEGALDLLLDARALYPSTSDGASSD